MRTIKTMIATAALIAALGTTAPARAETVLGLALGLSGSVAALGEQARRGAEAAVAAINAQGGVLGEPLRLEVGDDACDPKQAVAVANRMVTSGVKFVLGHLCSGASIAASDVYADEGVLMISASATNPQLTERGLDMVFRACGRDDQQGSVAGEMLAERFKDGKVALIHDKQAYGMGLVEEAAATMREKGVEPALVTSINAGERDFSALITRLKQEGIQAVYYGGYHVELGLIVRQAREQGLEALFVGADGIGTEEFWSIAGEAGSGTLFTFAPDAKSDPAAAEALAALKAGGIEPTNFAFYYYATVQVLQQAMEQAESAEPEAVADVLRQGNFQTVVGPMAFDDKGDLESPAYVFYEWKNGSFSPAPM